jgi:hypothetical protein
MRHRNPTYVEQRSGYSQIGILERTHSAVHIAAATAGSHQNVPFGVGSKMTRSRLASVGGAALRTSMSREGAHWRAYAREPRLRRAPCRRVPQVKAEGCLAVEP